MTEEEGSSPPFDLRAAIAELGMSQHGFARRMRELGDDRPEANILRSIQRMIAGSHRISGEMRAMVGMMREYRELEQSVIDKALKPEDVQS